MDLFLAQRLGFALIAVTTAWPFAQHLLSSHYRRYQRPKAQIHALILVTYATCLIVAFFLHPLLFCGLTTGGLLIWLGCEFRWHPLSGRDHGLPPGSLQPDYCRYAQRQSFFLEAYQRFGPVFKFSTGLQPAAGVVNQELGYAVLKDNQDALVPVPMHFNRHIPGGFLRYMPPSQHRCYRKLFIAALQSGIIEKHQPAIRSRALHHLQHHAEAADDAVSISKTIEAFVNEGLLQLFFGVTKERSHFASIRDALQVIELGQTQTPNKHTIEQALCTVERFCCTVAKQPETTGPSLLTKLIELNADATRDITLRRNLIYMFETARSDLSGLLLWSVKFLVDHPAWMTRLHDEALCASETSQSGSPLSLRIVMETLRMEQSEFIMRRTTKPIQVGGFTIPENWLIRICTREGHRTAPCYDNPGQFNPDRFLGEPAFGPNYAPLGLYGRRCIGKDIIALFGTTWLETMARHFICTRQSDGPAEFGRGHWRPSSNFNILLSPWPVT